VLQQQTGKRTCTKLSPPVTLPFFPVRFALSVLLMYIAAVIYYLYVRIAFTLDMKDKWCVGRALGAALAQGSAQHGTARHSTAQHGTAQHMQQLLLWRVASVLDDVCNSSRAR
jgi:hypothetical protein